jgi:hypothetical protein
MIPPFNPLALLNFFLFSREEVAINAFCSAGRKEQAFFVQFFFLGCVCGRRSVAFGFH